MFIFVTILGGVFSCFCLFHTLKPSGTVKVHCATIYLCENKKILHVPEKKHKTTKYIFFFFFHHDEEVLYQCRQADKGIMETAFCYWPLLLWRPFGAVLMAPKLALPGPVTLGQSANQSSSQAAPKLANPKMQQWWDVDVNGVLCRRQYW